jgi:hypothetical protein
MKTKTLLLILVSAILVSCSQAVTPTPTATSTPTSKSTSILPTATSLPEGLVIIKHTDEYLIGGTIYGHGETAVILASRGGFPQTEWSSVAQTVADAGFTALTIGSPENEGQVVIYERFAIEFLRENGFKRIICVGVSNGASGCAYNASEPEIIGLVLITYHGSAKLSDSTVPKLFMAAELDKTYRPQTERGYNAAAEPKELVIVPGTSEVGVLMLDTPGQNMRDTLVDFLKACTGE